ncbi:MAG: sialidase family protein [Candidatus Limnocylindrales bacterium]
MTSHRRVGSRAPLTGLAVAVFALLLLPGLVLGADWTGLDRISSKGGTRLDSLHQAAASSNVVHVVHPRVGPRKADDKVVYQRSTNDGKSWSGERTLFKAGQRFRKVVPNLALDARGPIVAVAYRVSGPKGHTLFVRVSRDGGRTFGGRVSIFSTKTKTGIGVPAVAIGNDLIAVAWTHRSNGQVKVRVSRNDGKSFRNTRTLGKTRVSIDCQAEVTDGLVGIAANDRSVHVAFSDAGKQQCYADDIKVRTSLDRGGSWSPARSITTRDSFGWPELDARGKTVVATVQSVSGSLIVSRSVKNGRNWREKVFAPPPGHIFSAADVTLLPKGRVVVAYVKERLEKGKLHSTRLVTRRSPNDGQKWNRPRPVTDEARRLRMAPNVVNDKNRVTILVQSGDLDGKPRHIFATRRR